MKKAMLETGIILKEFKKGKIRDIYDLDDRLLIVTTDRVSAFDVVMRQGIPDKGIVLNQLSDFWFRFIEEKGIIKNHLISTELPRRIIGVVFYDGKPFRICQEIGQKQKENLAQRIMIVKKTKVIPVEFIVRGYLAGSAWEKHKRGDWWLKKVRPNLKEGERLPFLLIQHTTKAEIGHDKDLDLRELYQVLERYFGTKEYIASRAETIMGKSFEIYKVASEYAEARGIIIADTKFEFGIDIEGNLLLVDELLTPDSSRFWLKEKWQPGKQQEGYDKQPLRDWLESTGWDKNPPPPDLPEEIIKLLAERYQEIRDRLILKTKKAEA